MARKSEDQRWDDVLEGIRSIDVGKMEEYEAEKRKDADQKLADLQACLDKELSEWEWDFVNDLTEQVSAQKNLTDKQYGKLLELWKKRCE